LILSDSCSTEGFYPMAKRASGNAPRAQAMQTKSGYSLTVLVFQNLDLRAKTRFLGKTKT
jgi:hypothetical protein